MSQETKSEESNGAYYLYGVVRSRGGWRGKERRNPELQRVRYRDIEAVVRPAAFELPPDHATAVRDHQQVLETLLHRTTVLPAPVGVLFNGRRPLIRLLQDQYLIFDEGLSLLDGHWELRLHITGTGTAEELVALEDEAMSVYSELRRFARAAVPMPQAEGKLASAAFLVDRTSWVEFIERIEHFGAHHRNLTFDTTGPWPAYDFVRIVT